MKKRSEISYYVSVGAGLALSTSSFLLISGLYETSNIIGVVLGVILSGGICGVIGIGIAEMAGLFPSAPGIRTYIKHGLNNKLSLMAIYLYVFMLILVAGAESHVFYLVVNHAFPGTNPILLFLIVFTFIALVNLNGIELTRWLQIAMTACLLSGIFLIGLNGIITYLVSDTTSPILSDPDLIVNGLVSLPNVLGIAIFLYIGFEWITPLGLNKDSYKKRIPYSMPLSVLINVVVYSTFCVGIGLNMTSGNISSSSIPQVFFLEQLFGDAGIYIALGFSVLAILSTFNAGLLGGSRFVYALAREKSFFKICSKISLKNGSPKGAILFLTTASFISATAVHYLHLDILFAIVSSSIVCIVYSLLMASLPKLRKKLPQKKRPFKTRLSMKVFWTFSGLMGILSIASLFTIIPLATKAGIILLSIILSCIGLTIYYDKDLRNKLFDHPKNKGLKWKTK